MSQASISVFCRVLCRREECEIGIFPFATRLPHEIDESSRNSNFLVFHPLKFPHSPFFFLHVAAFSRRGKRMMLITELFPFFLIQFLLLKALPSVPPEFPLSGAEVIIYVSKNPSTFSVPPGARPLPLSSVVVFPLKLFLRPKAAQFSWVLFIPRDKGGEDRERKK